MGFFDSTNFGKALMSVGDDFSDYAKNDARQQFLLELQQLKSERDEALRRLSAELKGGTAGTRSSGARTGSSDVTPEERDEYERSFTPFDRPTFEAARKRDQGGADRHTAADMSGAGMTGGLDSDEYRMTEQETPDSEMAAKNLPAYKRGLVLSRMDLKDYKPYQEGVTEEAKRGATLEAPTMDAAKEGARRINAYAGKGEYSAGEKTTTDTFAGTSSSTPVGKAAEGESRAKANKENASADDERASATNRRRGQDGDTRQERRSLETALNQTQESIRKWTSDSSLMRKVKKDPESEEAQEYGALLSRRDRLTRELGSLPSGRADPAAPARQNPKVDPKPDKFEIGKTYKDAKGNRAKYMGNGKWERV